MITQDELDLHPSWAQCDACGETFANDGHFDDHRYGGTCVSPEALGLTERGEIWGTEEGHQKRARDGARMAVLASRRFAVAEQHPESGAA